MMKWLIEVPVKHVSGSQFYEVEAETQEDAAEKFRTENGAEFISEELEVVDLDIAHMTITEKEA